MRWQKKKKKRMQSMETPPGCTRSVCFFFFTGRALIYLSFLCALFQEKEPNIYIYIYIEKERTVDTRHDSIYSPLKHFPLAPACAYDRWTTPSPCPSSRSTTSRSATFSARPRWEISASSRQAVIADPLCSVCCVRSPLRGAIIHGGFSCRQGLRRATVSTASGRAPDGS